MPCSTHTHTHNFFSNFNTFECWDFGSLGQSASGTKSQHVAVAFGASFGAAFVIVIIAMFIVWLRYRQNKQIFFDVNG